MAISPKYIYIVNPGTTTNAQVLPTPSKGNIKITTQDLYRSATRNAEGKMIMEFLRTIIKIELTYPYLEFTEHNTLLNYLKNNKDNLQLMIEQNQDYSDLGNKVYDVYCSDISYTPGYISISSISRTPNYYLDTKVNFIQI